MSQDHLKPTHHSQPKSFRLSFKSLLSLPYRLCNPPAPSVGKVRSCSVTPVYNVQLEDILNRKHLPPLGLKDFEEWLVYVEHSPENLYFILWLREYTTRYNRWALQVKPPNGPGEFHVTFPALGTSSLSMFYARAKQTFFTPNADYELDIPSDILSPFHISNPASPHPPDPAVFTEVADEVHKMLKESLARFVIAAYTNVGNTRGLCGILGGIAVGLLGSIPPLAVNFITHASRWLRLCALPGLWIGLTILIASLHGVCLMVYVFGDLRQLRKFELARPRISRPKPIRQLSVPVSSLVQTPITCPPILPISQSRRPSVQPSIQASLPLPPEQNPSSTTTSFFESECSRSCCSDDSSYSEEVPRARPEIHISEAFYDEHPAAEGPATCPLSINYTIPLKPKKGHLSPPDTATFIHAYEMPSDDEHDHSTGGNTPSPEVLQPISAFDFDALPVRRRVAPAHPPPSPTEIISALTDVPPHSTRILSPKTLLVRAQYKCNKFDEDVEKSSPTVLETPPTFRHENKSPKQTEAHVREQFKLIKAVPAFASPFTRILSPVVTRAQWEIAVRSALLGVLLSWGILGGILAIPVM